MAADIVIVDADGRQILKYSFDNFVYERGVVDIPFAYVVVAICVVVLLNPFCVAFIFISEEQFFGARYPPYTNQSLEFFSGVLQIPIPDSQALADL